jgi:hypothetical protein
MADSPKICDVKGHHYQPLGEKKDRRLETKGNDTYVFQTFYCTQCTNIVEKQVAVWPNWVSKRDRKSSGS